MAGLSNKERVGRVLDLVAAGLGPWMVDLLTRKYGDAWQAQVRAAAGTGPREFGDRRHGPVIPVLGVRQAVARSLFRNHAVARGEAVRVCALGRAQGVGARRPVHRRAGRASALRWGAPAAPCRRRQAGRRGRRSTARVPPAPVREGPEAQYQAAAGEAAHGPGSTLAACQRGGMSLSRTTTCPGDVPARTVRRRPAAGRARRRRPGVWRPGAFFERTYITRGLRYLLAQTLQRLNGVGGEPVIDLMTTFGGGKTHSSSPSTTSPAARRPTSCLASARCASRLGVAERPGRREPGRHRRQRLLRSRHGEVRRHRRQHHVGRARLAAWWQGGLRAASLGTTRTASRRRLPSSRHCSLSTRRASF